MNRLSGKVAVITGGNAGIGEAIAKAFAREGASVVITGRRQGELDRVVSDIVKEQGKAFAVAGSVTDEPHVQETVRRTVQQFGRLDILVNNAGVGDFGKRLHEIDDATWSQVLDVNLTGVFRMTRAVLPQMLKQGKGAIVNISSIASLVGLPTLPAYAASKDARAGMDTGQKPSSALAPLGRAPFRSPFPWSPPIVRHKGVVGVANTIKPDNTTLSEINSSKQPLAQVEPA